MQSLNSTSYIRRTLMVAGIGMLTAFLFLLPLTSFGASTVVTVSSPTAGSFVAGGSPITISGTVSPAPAASGTYIGVAVIEPNGQTATATELSVAASTGAFSGSITTGGPNFAANGTYTVNFNYNGATASVSLTYGSNQTTTASATGTTTTVVQDFTTTVSSVVTSATTIFSSVATTVTSVSAVQTTVTQVAQTTTTVSYTGGSSGTAEAIGAVAIIIAIIAVIFAVLAMRKK